MRIKTLWILALAAGVALTSTCAVAEPTRKPDGRNLPPAGPGVPYPRPGNWYWDDFGDLGWMQCSITVSTTNQTKSGKTVDGYRRYVMTTSCPTIQMVY